MENKKTNIIIILLCTIILLLGITLCVVLIGKQKDKPLPNKEDTINKEPTTEEVLTSIVGEWGKCKGEYDCQGVIISKNDKGFTYASYIMWSEGTPAGDITKIEKKDKDIYEITVHTDAYDYVTSSGPETTEVYTIKISEVLNNILIIDNNNYQKITTDREKFFNSIM